MSPAMFLHYLVFLILVADVSCVGRRLHLHCHLFLLDERFSMRIVFANDIGCACRNSKKFRWTACLFVTTSFFCLL